MNLEDYPTPETDGIATEGDWVQAGHARSLERRLAFARDTLRRVQNGYMRDAQRNLLIGTALRETNPPVDS